MRQRTNGFFGQTYEDEPLKRYRSGDSWEPRHFAVAALDERGVVADLKSTCPGSPNTGAFIAIGKNKFAFTFSPSIVLKPFGVVRTFLCQHEKDPRIEVGDGITMKEIERRKRRAWLLAPMPGGVVEGTVTSCYLWAKPDRQTEVKRAPLLDCLANHGGETVADPLLHVGAGAGHFSVRREPRDFWVAKEDATLHLLQPIRLAEITLLKTWYTLLMPGVDLKTVGASRLVQEREHIWRAYMEKLTTVKEAATDDPSVFKFEVSLDLGEACKYARHVDDLRSQ